VREEEEKSGFKMRMRPQETGDEESLLTRVRRERLKRLEALKKAEEERISGPSREQVEKRIAETKEQVEKRIRKKQNIKYLKEMGFTDYQATKALAYANDDLNTAIALLLEMNLFQNQEDPSPVLTKPTNSETTKDTKQNAAAAGGLEFEKPKNQQSDSAKEDNLHLTSGGDSEIDIPDDKLCVVCLETVRNTLIAPCGHVCLCFECADIVKSKQSCPMCRGPIEMVYKVYYS